MRSRALVWGTTLCLALGGAAGRAKSTRTVLVDCTKGESIAKALEEKADELILEIRGICEEEVQVRRSNVKLRGSDPLVDGIRPGPDEPLNQALNLFGVHLVVIENLQLSGGQIGLGINGSFLVDIINCRVEGNETIGLILGTASIADLVDSTITGNGGHGIQLVSGSELRCWGCTVQNNGAFRSAVVLSMGSSLRLIDGLLEGFSAIQARRGSRVWGGAGSTINGLPWALRARGQVSVDLFGAALEGQLELRQGSTAELVGVTHTSSAPPGLVRSGSTLVVGTGTTLGGDLQLSELSQAVFPAGTSLSGSLTCSLGADAFCADPLASIGGASDCARCLKP